jgi:uncharacterized membrane protein YbaN (DUF454 family)
MDSRQDGKRFPGCLKENARPSLTISVGLFFIRDLQWSRLDQMKQIRKSIWIFGGTVLIGLGVLGIFLPVLPTTPFLLLAAFCYGRGSERFYHWLVYRSWVGGYILNYQSGHGLPLKQKVLTITLLWLTIGSTIGLVTLAWWLKAALVVVAIGVTIHLTWMKTLQATSCIQADKMQFVEPMEDVL